MGKRVLWWWFLVNVLENRPKRDASPTRHTRDSLSVVPVRPRPPFTPSVGQAAGHRYKAPWPGTKSRLSVRKIPRHKWTAVAERVLSVCSLLSWRGLSCLFYGPCPRMRRMFFLSVHLTTLGYGRVLWLFLAYAAVRCSPRTVPRACSRDTHPTSVPQNSPNCQSVPVAGTLAFL